MYLLLFAYNLPIPISYVLCLALVCNVPTSRGELIRWAGHPSLVAGMRVNYVDRTATPARLPR